MWCSIMSLIMFFLAKNHKWIYLDLINHFSSVGFLPSMGYVRSWFDIWKSFKARHSRDGCRTLILLLNSASSSCWWKVQVQYSSLGVSFSITIYIISACNDYIKLLSFIFLSTLTIFPFKISLWKFRNKTLRSLKRILKHNFMILIIF